MRGEERAQSAKMSDVKLRKNPSESRIVTTVVDAKAQQEKDEINNLIRAQKYKAKFKLTLDDFIIMNGSVQKLQTVQSDTLICQKLTKRINREVVGPLIEKKVDTNEKLQYYVKRYCPIV